MTLRSGNSMLLFVAVLTTIGWASSVSAALVIDSSALPQPSHMDDGDATAPARPVSLPFGDDEEEHAPSTVFRWLLTSSGAGGSSPPSSGGSGCPVMAAPRDVPLVLPPLVAMVAISATLAYPEPVPFSLLRPPRCARGHA